MDGRYALVNDAFARLLGYQTSADLLQHVTDLNNQVYVDANRRRQFLRDLQRTGVVTGFEAQIFRADGSLVWVAESARLLHDPAGNVTGYTGIVEDTTLRRREQAAQAALRAHEVATRAKDDIVSTVSHELRTPLNGVIGMVGLLLGTPLSRDQRELAEAVQQSGETLLVIINDILDFAKIEAGRLPLESIELSVRGIVEDVVTLFAESAERKGFEICSIIDPAIPESVRGDPVRLRQILTNLVSNAVKFTDQGAVIVRAKLDRTEADEAVLRFEVTDTGPGLPPGAEDWLFQPFSQADRSVTRTHGGTGLGLAISQRLAHMMGGTIGTFPNPSGQGTEFWFTVRVSNADTRLAAPSSDLRDSRILVAHNNPIVAGILHEQLRGRGASPSIVSTAAAALAKLESAVRLGMHFDAIVIDVALADVDGLQFAALLKADPEFGSLPIVLLQPALRRVDDVNGPGSSTCEILSKPIRETYLFSALGRALRRVPSETSADTAPGKSPRVSGRAALLDGTRILIADDSPINRSVLIGMLLKLGCVVDAVTNGLEAVEAYRSKEYDAVLLDCEMPVVDGYSAASEIRALQQPGRRIPIIAVTGKVMESDRQRCLDSGMDDVVMKPIRLGDLEAALKHFVPSASLGRADAARTSLVQASAGRTMPIGDAAPVASSPTAVKTRNNGAQTRQLDSAFVRKFSHDLATPLNGILGFSELLLDERNGPLTELQAEFLAQLQQAGQDLLRLVREFAELARDV